MGIFNRIFDKSKTSGTIQELQNLKTKISELPKKYQTHAFVTGPGVGTVREQIPIISRNINDAIKALKTGLDPYNNPITKPQISDGLKHLVFETRKPAFTGLLSTIITTTGIIEFKNYMNELEKIAVRIK